MLESSGCLQHKAGRNCSGGIDGRPICLGNSARAARRREIAGVRGETVGGFRRVYVTGATPTRSATREEVVRGANGGRGPRRPSGENHRPRIAPGFGLASAPGRCATGPRRVSRGKPYSLTTRLGSLANGLLTDFPGQGKTVRDEEGPNLPFSRTNRDDFGTTRDSLNPYRPNPVIHPKIQISHIHAALAAVATSVPICQDHSDADRGARPRTRMTSASQPAAGEPGSP